MRLPLGNLASEIGDDVLPLLGPPSWRFPEYLARPTGMIHRINAQSWISCVFAGCGILSGMIASVLITILILALGMGSANAQQNCDPNYAKTPGNCDLNQIRNGFGTYN